jgi:hypothetical protein
MDLKYSSFSYSEEFLEISFTYYEAHKYNITFDILYINS